jgi:hypothetical protein
MQKRFPQTLRRPRRQGCSKRRTSRDARTTGERASPPPPWRRPWWAQRSPVPTTMTTGKNEAAPSRRALLRRGAAGGPLRPTSSKRRRRSSLIRHRWRTRPPIHPCGPPVWQPEPRRHPAAALGRITDRSQGPGCCPCKEPTNSSLPSQSDTYPPPLGRQEDVIPCCHRRL